MGIKQAVKKELEILPGESPASVPVGIGHNKPPLEELIPAEYRAALLEKRPDFLVRMDNAIEAASRAQAVDDETLGRCADLVGIYRGCKKHIEDVHKKVKQPYLDGGNLVQAETNALLERLKVAAEKVQRIGDNFEAERAARLNAERERIASEQREAAARAVAAQWERDELERQATAALANAKTPEERETEMRRVENARKVAEETMASAVLAASVPTKIEPVRSDAGSTASGKQEWQSQVEDYARAFKHVKSDPKVKEAIDAAVKRLVRAGQRELAGVKIWPVAKVSFR